MSSSPADLPRSSSPTPVFDELDELMRANTPPLERDEDEGNSGATTDNGNAGEGGMLPSSTGPVRNELVLARRLAVSAKLQPYQRQELETLVTSSDLVRDIMLFVTTCSTRNKLDGIVANSAPYEVTAALQENIDNVVIAVLLSHKLSAYKGDIGKDSVLQVLLRECHQIPESFDQDAHVQATIDAAIAETLTQTRSKIKKHIKDSLKNKTSLYDLATKLVKDTKCSVSVPLCGCLALLRNIFLVDSGAKFWDKVDHRLVEIRTRAQGDRDIISRIFRNLVKKDQDTYGSKPSDNIESEERNVWQQSIDETVAR